MKTTSFAPNYTQWNLPEGAKSRIGKEAINDIQFSPDGTRLAVARNTGILLYDAPTGKEISLLSGHTGYITSMVFSPDSCNLTGISPADSTIHLWDIATGHFLGTLNGMSKFIDVSNIHCVNTGISLDNLEFSLDILRDVDIPDFSWSGKINLYDIATDSFREFLPQRYGSNVLSANFSTDGHMRAIFVVSKVNSLLSIVFNTDRHIFVHDHESTKYIISVKLRDPNKHVLLKDLSISEEDVVNILAFSQDGYTIASTSVGSDSKIDLWDFATGKQLNTFRGHTATISSLCFSPDGCTLASGCRDGVVLLWDVVHETNKTTLTAEETQLDIDEINAIAQQAACEDEQYSVEDEQPIETRKTVELSADEQGLYDKLFGGADTKTATDSHANIKESTKVFAQRPYQIQQVCEELEIETLCHFTRIENLRSILQQGLIGRSFLAKSGQQFLWNDADRADRCPEANCLSISFPNYKMFWDIRKKKENSEGVNINSQWVVLLLDAKVLWELDCAFCQRNAASNAVRSIPLNERKKPEALKGLFEDFYGIKHQDLQIPQNYPTHPQAEVLVFDQIPTEYINAIHFRDATILEQWRSNYTGTYSGKFLVDRKYFDARYDYEVWRPEKFNDDGIPLSYLSDGNDEELDDFDGDIPF